jgi:hypothetical protein
MGLNTNNINPELLRFVDRKYEYSQLIVPLRLKDKAHPDDLAKYLRPLRTGAIRIVEKKKKKKKKKLFDTKLYVYFVT